jgi:predicted nucleic acid-binding Zn ribbon protein
MSPIFEYICARCTAEKKEEVLFYLTAKEPPQSPPDCPNCGSSKVMRKWNPANIRFKSNGFYSSDNKKGDDLDV